MSKRNKFGVPRSIRSWRLANIIIHFNLIDDFCIWRTLHSSVKSAFRAGTLFLLSKKLLWADVPERFSVNMDTLRDFYYGE